MIKEIAEPLFAESQVSTCAWLSTRHFVPRLVTVVEGAARGAVGPGRNRVVTSHADRVDRADRDDQVGRVEVQSSGRDRDE
jgi:hypothetical protein